MAVISIPTQPAANSLNACMRPIIIETNTLRTVPMVFCDVYINNIYYGSFEHTVPYSKTGVFLKWRFDIRDKVQEYFKNILPAANGGSTIPQGGASCRVFCKLRDSAMVNNVLVPQGAEPKQATGKQIAQPGDGTATNGFWTMYATLQHENVQNLETHLATLKNGDWRPDAYPLTDRPKNGYLVVPGGSDYFPFALKQEAIWGKLKLTYLKKGKVIWENTDYVYPAPPAVCYGIITGVTIQTSTVTGKANIIVTLDGAGKFVWVIPELNGGNPQGPVDTGSVETPQLAPGTYTVTLYPQCANGINGAAVIQQFTILPRPKAWRGKAASAFCVQSGGENTGQIAYNELEEVYTDVNPNTLTGQVKANDSNDPDYIPPAFNTVACPMPAPVGNGNPINAAFGNTEMAACATLESGYYISPLFADIGPGVFLYNDAAMTLPVTGFYIVKRADGTLFFVDANTGEIGQPTGNIC